MARAKKRIRKRWLVLLGIIVMLSCGFFYAYYWAFMDIQRLPRGKVVAEQMSPGGTYTVKAHLSDAGATTSFSILGVLYFNKEDRKPKTIYFQKDEEKASIIWRDDHTVIIDHVILKVPKETYDYRRK
jgi:flagellar basal body-associated protein FliL